MAIQFQCPSCQATIRVPDAAAGKKGTCPRCNEKLLVPNLGPESPAAASQPAPPGSRAAQPSVGLPPLEPVEESTPTPARATQPANVGPLGLPALDDEPGAPKPASSRLKAKGPKKGESRYAWVVPVLCILAVVGFLGWYTWKPTPKLEGELTAHAMPAADLEPGVIPRSDSGLADDELDEVLEQLKLKPMNWGSSMIKFTLFGSAEGVKVSVRNGQTSHFVVVDPSQNEVLVEYIQKHLEEMEKARLASLQIYAPQLYAAWKKHFDDNEPMTDQAKFRDEVLIPTLVSGLGYHLQAKVNDKPYPCVAEVDGKLYFLLPNATKTFQLVGKPMPDGIQIPANFTVKLKAGGSSPSRSSRGKTPAEREAENPGMNPDLHKPEGESTGTTDDEMPAKPKPKKRSRVKQP